MTEINLTDIAINPTVSGPQTVTYNELMQRMVDQLSDKFFYISIFLLLYVLMNMYVFKDGARLRNKFDNLCDKDKYPLWGSSVGGWIYEVIEDVALMGSLMLVILNVVYRTGINL